MDVVDFLKVLRRSLRVVRVFFDQVGCDDGADVIWRIHRGEMPYRGSVVLKDGTLFEYYKHGGGFDFCFGDVWLYVNVSYNKVWKNDFIWFNSYGVSKLNDGFDNERLHFLLPELFERGESHLLQSEQVGLMELSFLFAFDDI